MPAKRHREGQPRRGVAARRKLEFAVVCDQVRRRKPQFTARLQRHLRADGGCLLYAGTLDHKGYARINFKYGGRHVSIGAHRVFLILKICKPIPLEFEAGHEPGCKSRCCVRHVALQHYKSNAVTNGQKAARADVPF